MHPAKQTVQMKVPSNLAGWKAGCELWRPGRGVEDLSVSVWEMFAKDSKQARKGRQLKI